MGNLPAACRELAKKQGDRVGDDYFLAAAADVTLTACVLDWEQTVVDCVRDRRFLDEAIDAGSAMVRLAPRRPLFTRCIRSSMAQKTADDVPPRRSQSPPRAGRRPTLMP